MRLKPVMLALVLVVGTAEGAAGQSDGFQSAPPPQPRASPSPTPPPPPSAPQAVSPWPGGGTPTGTAQLTAGEIRGIADQIMECWPVDAGTQALPDIVVELRVDVDAGGIILNARPAPGASPSNPVERAVFERARRALFDPRCSTLRVARDTIPAVAAATFRFNPRGLVGR